MYVIQTYVCDIGVIDTVSTVNTDVCSYEFTFRICIIFKNLYFSLECMFLTLQSI